MATPSWRACARGVRHSRRARRGWTRRRSSPRLSRASASASSNRTPPSSRTSPTPSRPSSRASRRAPVAAERPGGSWAPRRQRNADRAGRPNDLAAAPTLYECADRAGCRHRADRSRCADRAAAPPCGRLNRARSWNWNLIGCSKDESRSARCTPRTGEDSGLSRCRCGRWARGTPIPHPRIARTGTANKLLCAHRESDMT
mmetsp:Transcript_28267/g.74678  ORF Transcript_28267/g.74678 Transcript_28267/m.74678 type:complete len:201 (-) Transcript_28267:57-659(-)